MKKIWPYWVLPLVHFGCVALAAFAVHYSNAVNLGVVDGDYTRAVVVAQDARDLMRLSNWLIPILIVILFIRRKEMAKESVWCALSVVTVIFATRTVFLGLIQFWQRNWIQHG